MPTTDTFKLPYPAGTDGPAGMAQIEAMAEALDDLLAGQIASCHRARPSTSTQNIQDSATEPVTGWAELLPAASISYSNGIFTFQRAGRYNVYGKITYPAVATPRGKREVVVTKVPKTGTPKMIDDFRAVPDAGYACSLPFSGADYFDIGDMLRVDTYQSQGATQVIGGIDPAYNHIHIERALFS